MKKLCAGVILESIGKLEREEEEGARYKKKGTAVVVRVWRTKEREVSSRESADCAFRSRPWRHDERHES